MTLNDFNAFCEGLTHAHMVRQWGETYVWKLDKKMFAIAWERNDTVEITFKATEIGFEVMSDMEGLRPAPYLASRGMKWIQQFELPGLDDDALREHLKLSYDLVSRNLTKKKQKELGLNQD